MNALPSVLDLKIRADTLPAHGDTIAFVAPANVLATLASAIGVDDVLSCEASLQVVSHGVVLRVTGTARARVIQTCGITLEPFETGIVESIDARYAPEKQIDASLAVRGGDEDDEGSAGMSDQPEPIRDGTIDLGALVQEHLVLGVDPYPRKPGATFAPTAPAGETDSPFAALATLRAKGTDEPS